MGGILKERMKKEPPSYHSQRRRAGAAEFNGGQCSMRSITQISEWPAVAIEELLAESESEGFHFVRRAQEEWLSHTNTFSKEGEAFFAVFENERLLAVGGVNQESARCGRLRRFYVCRQERGKGIGRQLLQHILAFARGHYSCIALRCDAPAADRFYLAAGFHRTSRDAGVTHMMDLKKEPKPEAAPEGFTSRFAH
jgi:GNAT superfamily N-acetyltransferase